MNLFLKLKRFPSLSISHGLYWAFLSYAVHEMLLCLMLGCTSCYLCFWNAAIQVSIFEFSGRQKREIN